MVVTHQAQQTVTGCVALLLSGCVYDLGTIDACEKDPEPCTQATSWPLLSTCTDKSPLQVEVGTGETSFRRFAPGEQPTLETGTGLQGPDIRHVWVGVRVDNPDPAGGKFRVRFRATVPDPAGGPGATRVALLKMVLADSLKLGQDGALSRAGIRFFVPTSPSALSVEVDDQCGRTASDSHTAAP